MQPLRPKPESGVFEVEGLEWGRKVDEEEVWVWFW